MAIDGTPVQGTFTPIERTRRAVIDTPYTAGGKPDAYALSIQRENIVVDANGVPVGPPTDAGTWTFWFSHIADDSVTANGVTLTVAQLAGFMQVYFDQKIAAAKVKETQPLTPPMV